MRFPTYRWALATCMMAIGTPLLCACSPSEPAADANMAADAASGCEDDPAIETASEAWLARESQAAFTPDPADAICLRDAIFARLNLGPTVGYKVGIYAPAARASYHSDKASLGILQRDMLQDEGEPVSVSFGYSPMAEADFILVVGDEGINSATTVDEAYRHVRGYRAFIELPDNNVPADTPLDLGRLLALDVNARKGVMGPEVPLPQTDAGRRALQALTVSETIATPPGTRDNKALARETLDDPLQVLLTARDLLKDEGRSLAAGDLVSIGTITPPHAPVAGEVFTVHYQIDGSPSTIVQRFTP